MHDLLFEKVRQRSGEFKTLLPTKDEAGRYVTELLSLLFARSHGVTGERSEAWRTELAASLSFPDFSRALEPAVLRLALTIGLVASVESLLSVEASDKLDPRRRITPMNRELKAQGVGNIVAGLLGALPVTAVMAPPLVVTCMR